MIFYTLHDCKVSKLSQILKDSKFVSKISLPKFITSRVASNLIIAFNKSRNTIDESKNIGDEYYKTNLYVRIMMFRLLHNALLYEVGEKSNRMFRKYFYKDYESGDIEKVKAKIEKLEALYAAIGTTDLVALDFDIYIGDLEMILGIDLSDKFIYRIEYYEKQALLKKEEHARIK
jgi:hypothetical protein